GRQWLGWHVNRGEWAGDVGSARQPRPLGGHDGRHAARRRAGDTNTGDRDQRGDAHNPHRTHTHPPGRGIGRGYAAWRCPCPEEATRQMRGPGRVREGAGPGGDRKMRTTAQAPQVPMPLANLTLPRTDDSLPPEVARFIRESERRIDRFQDECRVPGFVPSDYPGAYGVLRGLASGTMARGRQFCEWGSGFGVVACLASMLDFDACGIEVEGVLVDEARQLADDFGLPVEFALGSFIPRGAEDRVHAGGVYSWMTTEGDYAYEELGLEVRDLD